MPADYLNKPRGGDRQGVRRNYAALVEHTRKLVQVQRAGARARRSSDERRAQQTEHVRKMLLAFSRDLRVVLLRLASRLQTLRWYAASKQPCAAERWRASRCRCSRRWPTGWASGRSSGRWKTWRSASSSPTTYKRVARLLDEKRVEREQCVEQLRARLERRAAARTASRAQVQGRPKHIYSIWQEDARQGARLRPGVRHPRAARDRAPTCRTAMRRWPACTSASRRSASEFDDYIAKPKANGYQSLHTVVRDDDGRPIEIQIRTQAMHEHAEHGVAAHWAYKEAGSKGYAGVVRPAVRVRRQDRACCASCWPGSATSSAGAAAQGLFEDRIYVLHAAGGDRRAAAGRDAGRLRLHACTPTWATAAAARGSTARWCR